jgi:hypothetical protein
VQPAQINVGRDVSLHIRVTDARGGLVPGVLISLTGTSRPLLASAPHGLLTVLVHATALGAATLQVSRAGFATTVLRIPIVPGPPATIVAFKRGVSVQAPQTSPRPGRVGTDLLDQYHALTARNQLASLGLRDGTLVDLNANTNVLIRDPLHAVLSAGELFLEVVHGAVSHQVQVGTVVAATKGTRLDVRVDAKTKLVTVTVVEGRVAVSNRGVTVQVGAGQQTSVPPSRVPSPPQPANLNKVVGWVNGLPNSTATVVPPILNLPPPVISPVPVPPVATTPAITVTGTLASGTWSRGPYLLQGQTTLPAGATLTIDPGTVIEMGSSGALLVQGTLKAQGTAAAPIVFTSDSAQPAPDSWYGLVVDGATAVNSVLDHVQVFYGSATSSGDALLALTEGANITVSNSVFAQGSGNGIAVDNNTRPTISNCTFGNLANYAITAPVDDLGLITGAGFGPNQRGFQLAGGTISHSANWEAPGAPFVLEGGVTLPAGVSLTLPPGLVVEMGSSGSLLVQGTLVARGTAAAPIVFTSDSAQPAPDSWYGLVVDGATALNSVLDHVQVFYGSATSSGDALLALTEGANITVSNSVFAQGSGNGIAVDGNTRPTISTCVFAGLTGYAITAPVDDLGLITGAGFGPNQRGFQLAGGTISHSASWEAPGVPFVLEGGVTLPAGVSLTLPPGLVVEMGSNGSLLVQGTLVARGTAAAPIVFTSDSAQPAPDSWYGLVVDGATALNSVLDHVQVFYGSATSSGDALLALTEGANITVSNSVFAQGSGNGIAVDGTTRPTISTCVFAGLTGYAITAPVDDLGLITGAGFGPNQRGFQLAGGTISHSASWEAPGVPFVLEGGVTLPAGVSLTLPPGLVVEMGSNGSLLVQGTLVARGTAAAPIVFTSDSAQPAPDNWYGLVVDGAKAQASVLDHVQVLYGSATSSGDALLALTEGANITVSNSVFAHGSSGGIWVDDGTSPTIVFCSFTDLRGAAISIPKQDAASVHDNSIGPGQQGIQLRG